MVKYITGDATKPEGGEPRIIAHVCNNVGGWGSGFVLALNRQFGTKILSPRDMYRSWHRQARTYSVLHYRNVPFSLGQVQFVPTGEGVVVANMVAQNRTISESPDSGPPIRYDALELCLAQVGDYADRERCTVHMPRIGCGLAGGTWDRVGAIVEDMLEGIDVTVYDLA